MIPLKQRNIKNRKAEIGYYKIARHYKWALSQVFDEMNYQYVIVVEGTLYPPIVSLREGNGKYVEQSPTSSQMIWTSHLTSIPTFLLCVFFSIRTPWCGASQLGMTTARMGILTSSTMVRLVYGSESNDFYNPFDKV